MIVKKEIENKEKRKLSDSINCLTSGNKDEGATL